MITIRPIPRALVPTNSAAAARVSAPNYDEFQGDREIWDAIRQNPECVLKVTMAHCDVGSQEQIGKGDSQESLSRAGENMRGLTVGSLTREVRDALFVYEIVGPQNPGVRQIGLGGMASTAEIRTDATPEGTIIRNEGVREPKARGRANLIEATGAIVGTVNNAVPDESGQVVAALEAYADTRSPDFEVDDQHGNRHRIWLVELEADIHRFQALLAGEPEAYVADGNHRSAAAAMLGHKSFLAIFFTASRMGISPYNRLVEGAVLPPDDLMAAISKSFQLHASQVGVPYQPSNMRSIGLYAKEEGWRRLEPLSHTFDATNAAESIDHDIVQRHLFGGVLGIEDARDDRLTFVGANKTAEWLQQQVDDGRATYAVTLAAVTMAQFIEVCRQNKMMPPKSTWFEPKIRSGLVMALLSERE